MEEVDCSLVESWIKDGKTYAWISEQLQQLYPNISRGLSVRSVRRFCNNHNISKMTDDELDDVVTDAVKDVGEVYGRKMMKGYLASSLDIDVGEHRIASSLQRVDPEGYERRRSDTVDRANPIPYSARYFGHKLHMDQNEKLIRYGVTHVIAVDGFSGKIVAHTSMPIKNNLTIYQKVYREAVLQYGLWHQLRVDHGREFYLSLYVQNRARELHGPQDITSFCQTPSTQNLAVERLWVQVNSRVNYPVKRVLVKMEENQLLDLSNTTTQYCVSYVLINTCNVGMERFVGSWNAHSIAGKGIPNNLALNCNTSPVPVSAVPVVDTAAREYQRDQGQLTLFSNFGTDPIGNRQDLIRRREHLFHSKGFTYENMFTNTVSDDGQKLVNGILMHIELTNRLSLLL
ncbi:PREDICTED: uncharacterized protein LOC109589075 isoform X1 [Amphimedon queenslandica]|uniref:Integrase core domain-containing protein n=1 Tax=Amphimedon queenslandica TaxID=400682 RepID=A0A1X7T9M5_AMPQE|nr:PREDICTED: uncharacterized protein LOC109589075 isoform X1 [Amphimedon queenslandica]|eukprot:XP_019860756.1 PREDICTED: uncharacterized protein LOC109589075 isoform X1 [Amphimedon queenslandica]